MVKGRLLNLRGIRLGHNRFWIAACMLVVSACTEVIEEGSFQFLDIGDKMDIVAGKIKEAGIKFVRAQEGNRMTVRAGNIGQLDDIFKSSGIKITDSKHYSVMMEFEGDDTKNVNFSYGMSLKDREEFLSKNRRSDMYAHVKELLLSNRGLLAFNYLAGSRSINLTTATSEEMDYLFNNDVWEFRRYWDEKSAHYLLYFDSGVLSRIRYKRNYIGK